MSDILIYPPTSADYQLSSVSVNIGDVVKKGQEIAYIKLLINNINLRIVCSRTGILKAFAGPLNSTHKEDTPVAIIKPCDHQQSFNGTCIVCNEPVTIATTGHRSTIIGISKSQAIKHHNQSIIRLISQKKLILVVDLDHTLVHCVKESDVAEYFLHPVSKRPLTQDIIPLDWVHRQGRGILPTEEQLIGSENSIYRFITLGQKICLKFRPFVMHFLREMSTMFEMHMYTMGRREYADKVIEYLDPDNKFFGHRVLSRTESFSSQTKSLNRLFPGGDSMIMVLDDRSDVWPSCPNLIPVERFKFFPGDMRHTLIPGLVYQKTPLLTHDSDNYLVKVSKILENLHSQFFTKFESSLANHAVLPTLQETFWKSLEARKRKLTRQKALSYATETLLDRKNLFPPASTGFFSSSTNSSDTTNPPTSSTPTEESKSSNSNSVYDSSPTANHTYTAKPTPITLSSKKKRKRRRVVQSNPKDSLAKDPIESLYPYQDLIVKTVNTDLDIKQLLFDYQTTVLQDCILYFDNDPSIKNTAEYIKDVRKLSRIATQLGAQVVSSIEDENRPITHVLCLAPDSIPRFQYIKIKYDKKNRIVHGVTIDWFFHSIYQLSNLNPEPYSVLTSPPLPPFTSTSLETLNTLYHTYYITRVKYVQSKQKINPHGQLIQSPPGFKISDGSSSAREKRPRDEYSDGSLAIIPPKTKPHYFDTGNSKDEGFSSSFNGDDNENDDIEDDDSDDIDDDFENSTGGWTFNPDVLPPLPGSSRSEFTPKNQFNSQPFSPNSEKESSFFEDFNDDTFLEEFQDQFEDEIEENSDNSD